MSDSIWETILVPDELKDNVSAVLDAWWESEQLMPNQVPLRYVGFIPVKLPLQGKDPPSSNLPLQRSNAALHTELENKCYLVFYVRMGQILRVLGAYPSHLLKRALETRETMLLGDLWRARCYDEWPVYVGARLPNCIAPRVHADGDHARSCFLSPSHSLLRNRTATHWLPIPARGTETLCTSSARASAWKWRRFDLMLLWWRERVNSRFIYTDGPTILLVLHEQREMDLTCDTGREAELTAYWLLVFICAHDPWLWEVRSYWERSLLEWRIRHYYPMDKHFAICIQNNAKHCPVVKLENETQVDGRELLLYGKRHPGAPTPGLWVTVPITSVGPDLLGSTLYDTERGVIIITRRDFLQWAWHQMDVAATDMMKSVSAQLNHVEEGDDAFMTRYHTDPDARHMVDAFLVRCQRFRDQERARVIASQAKIAALAELPDISTAPALINAAKTRFPLCMAQHVFAAFEEGTHPKNASRVAFAKFLIEAGYPVEQVDAAMFSLYASDREFLARYPPGGWNETSYHVEFGIQTLHMYKGIIQSRIPTLGAYKCETLVEAARKGSAHGCPFFR